MWIAAAMGAALVAILALVRSIRGLIRKLRAAVVVSLPLVARQGVELPEAGSYELWVEGRRMTRDFQGLDYELVHASGLALPMRRLLLAASSTGMSKVRLKVRSFETSHPGSFTLRVTGLSAEPGPESRLVVSRPVGGVIASHVLVIVAAGMLLIGAIVFTALMSSGAI